MVGIEEVIERKREYERKYSEYVEVLRGRSSREKLEELGELRRLPVGVLEELGIFYVGNMVEMVIPEYIRYLKGFGLISSSNNKPIFNDRWVMPIKNELGLVENLVGYSNKADERYIYGTGKYYRRRDTLYGLENLWLAYEMGYAILTEGITDTIRLRSMGIKNSFAMCGTHKSEYIMRQLNRCRYGIIKIPDRDKAGVLAERNWVVNRSITIHISVLYKDIDEMLRDGSNEGVFKECFGVCVEYLKEREHKGLIYPPKEYTIII